MLELKPLRDEENDRGHTEEQVTSQVKAQRTSLTVKLTLLCASILALTIIAFRFNIGSGVAINQALLKEATSASLLDERNRFILKESFSSKNFASFLPGIGGTFGVPLWCFYVNRGQGIAAFGITTKDYPLMEFKPANQAWQQVSRTGFRTYIRGTSGTQSFEYQPFFIDDEQELQTIHRSMYTGMNEFEIEEVNDELNLRTNILYFNIPNNDFAGLVRRMTLTNTGHKDLEMELLDGLQVLLPFGVTDGALTTISRTLEAWMNVFGIDEDPTTPFYHLITSFVDSEVVEVLKKGNYAVAFIESDDNLDAEGRYERLPFIVDPAVIYGNATALSSPDEFLNKGLEAVFEAKQVTGSKTPCALYGSKLHIKKGHSITLTSVYGMSTDIETFTDHIIPTVTTPGFIENSRNDAEKLTVELTACVATASGHKVFDAYIRQNQLDNLLRGGFPIMLGDGDNKYPFHTYSRIHGDLERDYNYFVVAPTYYSYGPGNFRDVWQNRRNDVLQVPQVGDFNVRGYFSLIDSAGYNPLTVSAANFTITDRNRAAEIATLSGITEPHTLKGLTDLLNGPGWKPGDIFTTLENYGAGNGTMTMGMQDFVDLAVGASVQNFDAVFGQGFWTDHWTYGLDLIDTYLAVFPDKEADLLFDGEPVNTFFAPAMVAPRNKKYVLFHGTPRQIGACLYDKAKQAAASKIWQLTAEAEIFTMPLFTKILLLATVRMSALDPGGMGLEMEGGKPGWLDALNGLPSFFGSSMPETFELLRLVRYLDTALTRYPRDVAVPEELSSLITELNNNIAQRNSGAISDFEYWDNVYTAKEEYRELTKLNFTGASVKWTASDLTAAFDLWEAKLETGIQAAIDLNDGFVPTYFQWTATSWTVLDGKDSAGRSYVQVHGFEPTVLQKFLEGPVRRMKTLANEDKFALYQQVKASPIYDSVLQMFKISESLKELSPNVGRLSVFASGWLENESIWLHMSYKFYLELLRGELFDEFWLEAQTGLVPFMNPDVYGRSLLEASSFLVSSANPDPTLWGTGFVSRLSGSTAEFMSMYNTFMAGETPYFLDASGTLYLQLKPALPGWLFSEDNSLSFTFLGATTVTYFNPQRLNTWDPTVSAVKSIVTLSDGSRSIFEGSVLGPDIALLAREGKLPLIEMYFDSE